MAKSDCRLCVFHGTRWKPQNFGASQSWGRKSARKSTFCMGKRKYLRIPQGTEPMFQTGSGADRKTDLPGCTRNRKVGLQKAVRKIVPIRQIGCKRACLVRTLPRWARCYIMRPIRASATTNPQWWLFDAKTCQNLDQSSYVYVKGNFEPLVSEETWDRCQQILLSKSARVIDENGKKHKYMRNTPKSIWTAKSRGATVVLDLSSSSGA